MNQVLITELHISLNKFTRQNESDKTVLVCESHVKAVKLINLHVHVIENEFM